MGRGRDMIIGRRGDSLTGRLLEQVFDIQSDLGKLKKQLKVNHPLAVELWKSGNHDARILALMIADPAQMTGADVEAWSKDITNHVLGCAFAGVAAKTSSAREKMQKWTTAKSESLSA